MSEKTNRQNQLRKANGAPLLCVPELKLTPCNAGKLCHKFQLRKIGLGNYSASYPAFKCVYSFEFAINSAVSKLITATLIFAGIGGGIVQAAALPGSVQPGQIERQFTKPPEIRSDQPSKVIVPEADQSVPSNAQDIRFKLNRLVIDGATVYSGEALSADYKNRLNTEVALSDIYQIASALTAKYRNGGYILSQVVVPAQSIEDGVVHLKVIEGYVADVTIDGADGSQHKLVQDYAVRIKQSRPLTNAVLERYLLLMNDLPGVFARATIKSSRTEPGASEMTIQFSQRKVLGGLSLDNRGGKSLGPSRFSGNIALNSVLGLEESTVLRFVSSGDSELKYFALSHDEQAGSDGDKLNLSLSMVRSKPQELAFILLNLETESESAALTYSKPLLRSRSENLTLRGSFSAHNGKTQIFGVDDSRDHVRAVHLGMTYDLADSRRGLNLLDVELSQGVNVLGASDNHDPMLSRPNARADFTKATLYAARLQSLAPQWSALVALNAQHAFTDLLSSELYSFGGEQFGRGYDPSELVGDHGAAIKLELRYTGTLPASIASSYTGYGFYDVGKVYQRSPGGLASSESAASAGLGLRISMSQNISGFVEVAKPLTHEVAAENNRDTRGYAGVSIRF